jgi:hypothetical protein
MKPGLHKAVHVVRHFMKVKNCLIALLVLSSCSDPPDKTSKVSFDSTVHLQRDLDTITSISQKPVVVENTAMQYASQIISGQVRPSDNEQTFAWLDSLHSNNRDTRDFAFKVYRSIVIRSDGALSEAICEYIKEYFASYPKEFLYNYVALNNQEKALTNESIAFEFYASGTDYASNLEGYFRKIETSCTTCTQADKVALKAIRSTLEEEIREMQK